MRVAASLRRMGSFGVEARAWPNRAVAGAPYCLSALMSVAGSKALFAHLPAMEKSEAAARKAREALMVSVADNSGASAAFKPQMHRWMFMRSS